MTHCERVLNRLRQGPASHLELYALGTVAHSRISDLRKKGHQIEQWRDGDLYMYRLSSIRPAQDPPGASEATLLADNAEGHGMAETGGPSTSFQLRLAT